MSAVIPQPITDEQRVTFEAIRNPEYTNFAIVSSVLDGEPVACIAALIDAEDGTDDTWIHPVAVIVTDAIFARLTDPQVGLEDEEDAS